MKIAKLYVISLLISVSISIGNPPHDATVSMVCIIEPPPKIDQFGTARIDCLNHLRRCIGCLTSRISEDALPWDIKDGRKLLTGKESFNQGN